jgi:D-hydroxyproline dehydrogenase subunit alpha
MPTSDARGRVCVIGAGPAGLAATVAAAQLGVDVVVLDAAAEPGGQFWRHRPAGLAADADLYHDADDFDALSSAARDLSDAGRLTYLPSHHVWSLAVTADGCTVNAIDTRDRSVSKPVVVDATHLIIAVGAFDRQIPFPGWDLPGVMTAGAAQALLKGHGVVVGPRVIVAGTGPFLLPVAAGLLVRGAEILGVYEANRPGRWLHHPRALIAGRGKLLEAARYVAALLRHRVPIRHRSIVVAAHGVDGLDAVTVAKLDHAGSRVPGSERRIDVDILAVGWGFTAQAELLVAAGVDLRVDVDGSPRVITDRQQLTSNPRVFAAGEVAGVGGAQLAVVEGRIAGVAAARAAGAPVRPRDDGLAAASRRRARLRRFAAAMHAVYPVPTSWLSALTPDTVVCRCEEVTVANIDTAVELGARDPHSTKLLSRAGMGLCQGRVCGYAVACLVAQRTGTRPDLSAGSERVIATPVPLGLVAEQGQ